MKDAFERGLKQKLEQATPEELGYRPDRDQLWSRITTQQKKPKALPLVTWITHAAAIAAGLLIGAFFLNRENHPTTAEQMPAMALSQKVKVRTDTVYVLQTSPGDKQNKTAIAAPAAVLPPRTQQAPVPQVIQQEQIARDESPAPAALPREATIASNRQSPKVLHLSDMGNENSIPQSRIIKIPILVQLFASPNLLDDKQASASASVLIRQQVADTKN